MAEQRITITIDEQGAIDAKTSGFKGDACLEELEALLGDVLDLQEVKKTDEFFQQKNLNIQNKIQQGSQ